MMAFKQLWQNTLNWGMLSLLALKICYCLQPLPHMPIHSVIKESSTSTKIRAVFDASAATSTKASLNDLLSVGPTIQPSRDQTLLK